MSHRATQSMQIMHIDAMNNNEVNYIHSFYVLNLLKYITEQVNHCNCKNINMLKTNYQEQRRVFLPLA